MSYQQTLFSRQLQDTSQSETDTSVSRIPTPNISLSERFHQIHMNRKTQKDTKIATTAPTTTVLPIVSALKPFNLSAGMQKPTTLSDQMNRARKVAFESSSWSESSSLVSYGDDSHQSDSWVCEAEEDDPFGESEVTQTISENKTAQTGQQSFAQPCPCHIPCPNDINLLLGIISEMKQRIQALENAMNSQPGPPLNTAGL